MPVSLLQLNHRMNSLDFILIDWELRAGEWDEFLICNASGMQ